jgi:uncharacterized membrane protein
MSKLGFWASTTTGLLLWLGLEQACSVNEGSVLPTNSGGAAATVGIGGATNGTSAPTPGGGSISIDVTGQGGSAGTTGVAVACTEGEACDCPKISLALLGKPGQFGDRDSTAFMTWLNSSSAGTAKVDSYTERTTLTADFLAQYNVVILLGLGDDSNNGPFWTYDASELAAVQDWVQTKGGGLITLSGASGQSNEANPNNQLIAFTGISYVPGSWITPTTCLNVDASGQDKCSYCCGQAAPIADFNRTDPVITNLSNSIKWVGMHGGRSINAPADAHVAATIPCNGSTYNVIVGKPVGKGRVLAFTDEWITYTSQWHSSNTDPQCAGYLPQDVYQTAQVWYNMIKWVQPKATCFKIVDPHQTVVIW